MRPILGAMLLCVLVNEVAADRSRRQAAVYNLLAESDLFFLNFSRNFNLTTLGMVMSPYSLHCALAQTASFAMGPSGDQMMKALGLTFIPWHQIGYLYDGLNTQLQYLFYRHNIHILDPKILIACGSKVMQLRGIRDLYPHESLMFLGQTTPCVNPEAIRSYLESKTGDIIRIQVPPELLGPGNVLLVDTMVMRAEWQDKFSRNMTHKRLFASMDPTLTSITVDMMRRVLTVGWKKDEELKVDVVEIPLRGGDLKFYIVLPHETRGVLDVDKRLLASGRTIANLASGLTPTAVHLEIPKFRINRVLKLKQVLQNMGIVMAFSADTAHFSRYFYLNKLYLSEVIHATDIEVNEEGISPSAQTPQLQLGTNSSVTSKQTFIADHPFSFFIRHDYLGRVLITGRYTGQ